MQKTTKKFSTFRLPSLTGIVAYDPISKSGFFSKQTFVYVLGLGCLYGLALLVSPMIALLVLASCSIKVLFMVENNYRLFSSLWQLLYSTVFGTLNLAYQTLSYDPVARHNGFMNLPTGLLVLVLLAACFENSMYLSQPYTMLLRVVCGLKAVSILENKYHVIERSFAFLSDVLRAIYSKINTFISPVITLLAKLFSPLTRPVVVVMGPFWSVTFGRLFGTKTEEMDKISSSQKLEDPNSIPENTSIQSTTPSVAPHGSPVQHPQAQEDLDKNGTTLPASSPTHNASTGESVVIDPTQQPEPGLSFETPIKNQLGAHNRISPDSSQKSSPTTLSKRELSEKSTQYLQDFFKWCGEMDNEIDSPMRTPSDVEASPNSAQNFINDDTDSLLDAEQKSTDTLNQVLNGLFKSKEVNRHHLVDFNRHLRQLLEKRDTYGIYKKSLESMKLAPNNSQNPREWVYLDGELNPIKWLRRGLVIANGRDFQQLASINVKNSMLKKSSTLSFFSTPSSKPSLSHSSHQCAWQLIGTVKLLDAIRQGTIFDSSKAADAAFDVAWIALLGAQEPSKLNDLLQGQHAEHVDPFTDALNQLFVYDKNGNFQEDFKTVYEEVLSVFKRVAEKNPKDTLPCDQSPDVTQTTSIPGIVSIV